jgi:hypothetical protein
MDLVFDVPILANVVPQYWERFSHRGEVVANNRLINDVDPAFENVPTRLDA